MFWQTLNNRWPSGLNGEKNETYDYNILEPQCLKKKRSWNLLCWSVRLFQKELWSSNKKSNCKEGLVVVTFYLLNLHNDKQQITLASICDQCCWKMQKTQTKSIIKAITCWVRSAPVFSWICDKRKHLTGLSFFLPAPNIMWWDEAQISMLPTTNISWERT